MHQLPPLRANELSACSAGITKSTDDGHTWSPPMAVRPRLAGTRARADCCTHARGALVRRRAKAATSPLASYDAKNAKLLWLQLRTWGVSICRLYFRSHCAIQFSTRYTDLSIRFYLHVSTKHTHTHTHTGRRVLTLSCPSMLSHRLAGATAQPHHLGWHSVTSTMRCLLRHMTLRTECRRTRM